jgi:hypothetical protein
MLNFTANRSFPRSYSPTPTPGLWVASGSVIETTSGRASESFARKSSSSALFSFESWRVARQNESGATLVPVTATRLCAFLRGYDEIKQARSQKGTATLERVHALKKQAARR